MAEHAPSMSMYDIHALSLLYSVLESPFSWTPSSLSLPPMLSQSVPSLSALPFPPSFPPMGAITVLRQSDKSFEAEMSHGDPALAFD